MECDQIANIAGWPGLHRSIPRQGLCKLLSTEAEGEHARRIWFIQAMRKGRCANEQSLGIGGMVNHLEVAQMSSAGISTQVTREKSRQCDIGVSAQNGRQSHTHGTASFAYRGAMPRPLRYNAHRLGWLWQVGRRVFQACQHTCGSGSPKHLRLPPQVFLTHDCTSSRNSEGTSFNPYLPPFYPPFPPYVSPSSMCSSITKESGNFKLFDVVISNSK